MLLIAYVSGEAKTRGTIQHWDLVTNQVKTLVHPQSTLDRGDGMIKAHIENVIAFSPNGMRLASVDDEYVIHVWNLETESVEATLSNDTLLRSGAFSPDNTRLLVDSFGVIQLWDTASGQSVATFGDSEFTVGAATFSLDGRHIKMVCDDHVIRFCDADTGKLMDEQRSIKDVHRGMLAFSPDGARLASLRGSSIHLWDTQTGLELPSLQGHRNLGGPSAYGFAFSGDGTRLATSSFNDRSIQIWDVSVDSDVTDVLTKDQGKIGSIAFSPDGRLLAVGHQATGASESTVTIWDVEARSRLATLEGHVSDIKSVAFRPDGRMLASGSRDQTIMLWDTVTGLNLNTLQGHTGSIESIAFNANGTGLFSLGTDKSTGSMDDKSLRSWDPDAGIELDLGMGKAGSFVVFPGQQISISSNGINLATASPDLEGLSGATPWDVVLLALDSDVPRKLQQLAGYESLPSSVAFSPDGAQLAVGDTSGAIRLWDPGTGKELNVMQGHKISVNMIVYSPDGNRMASESSDNTIRIWDSETGEEMLTLENPTGKLRKTVLAFSPDGLTVASASDDGTIRLWDTRSRNQLITNRTLARQRAAELAPLVDSWVEKANGDDELVVALLERELKGHVPTVAITLDPIELVNDRTPEEATTLRNLVLKKLSEHRQARETEAAQPAVP